MTDKNGVLTLYVTVTVPRITNDAYGAQHQNFVKNEVTACSIRCTREEADMITARFREGNKDNKNTGARWTGDVEL